MSSKNSLIQIPWPKRVNSDISPSMLAPDESPVIRNIKTRALPYDVRPRNGMKYVGTWQAASGSGTGTKDFKANPASWIPYHAIFSPASDTIIVGLVNQEANASPDWPFYYVVQEVVNASSAYGSSGLSSGGGQFPWAKPNVLVGIAPYSIGKVVLTISNGVGTLANGVWRSDGPSEYLSFWGQPTYYDSSVFFTLADPSKRNGLTLRTKYWDGTSATTKALQDGQLNKIIQWGGTYNPTGTFDPLTKKTATASSWGTNGSVTMNLNVAPGTGVSPMGYIHTLNGTVGTGGMTAPAYTYNYRVTSGGASITTMALDRAYGLGESSTNVPTATTTGAPSTTQPMQSLLGSPPGIWTTAVFNDRLFGARGRVSAALSSGATAQEWPTPINEYSGDYPNALMWSKPGNPQKWPDQNFVLVGSDGNEQISALAALNDKLIIFKPNRTYVLTGYDEESFQINKLSDVVGCPYPNAVALYENTLYFANQDGVWATDGTSIRQISAPQPGHGITALWNSRKWSRAQGMSVRFFWPTMAVTPDAHLVFCCHYPLSTSDYADNFVYDIRNDAWSEWGMSDKTLNPIRVVQAPNGNVYGIHRWFITDITDCWNVGVVTQVYDEYPLLSDGTMTKLAVVPEIETWFSASPGNTFRVNEMQIDHKVHYSYATSGLGYTPWTIQFATDPDLVLGTTEHSITARWVTTSGYSSTQPRHYSDRLPETYQREAQTMRVKLTGNTYPDNKLAMKDWTLLAMKFTVSATRQMGVDNSTT